MQNCFSNLLFEELHDMTFCDVDQTSVDLRILHFKEFEDERDQG
jgi:hypothetical protein